jgi:hypothetical protein
LRKLIIRLLLLTAPLIACGVFVLYVDPFNYFHWFKGIPLDSKKAIVYKDDRIWWNAIEYSHAPSPYFIIGDSRADLISTERLSEKTGRRYMHLSASACKINEMADLFWFANSRSKPESVYIVIHFNVYNHYAFSDRVAGVEAIIRNPLLYLYNRHVIRTAVVILKSVFLAGKARSSGPPRDKAGFWAWSLEHWPEQQYGKWKYPAEGYEKLRRVSDFCRQQNIRLTFIIAPSHVDYQKKADQFGLGGEMIRFKKDVSSLSTTVDFDFASDLTRNPDNFKDPVHVKESVADTLMDEILTGKLHYGRLLKNR